MKGEGKGTGEGKFKTSNTPNLGVSSP